MTSIQFRNRPRTATPADEVLVAVLERIAVPGAVLDEAKKRRNAVLAIATDHGAYAGTWNSGSLAHGTAISPLGDADCGIALRRDAAGVATYGPRVGLYGGQGPDGFIRDMAKWLEPRLLTAGYRNARLDLTGNRAIRVEFKEVVQIDQFGEVDPSVDLILGIPRGDDQPGFWIPNRRSAGWDPANPQEHTRLMLAPRGSELAVHRAQVVRLLKRAIANRAELRGFPAMCSWNLSALALGAVREVQTIGSSLESLCRYASASIAQALTDDPAGVAGPIRLPEGSSRELASRELNAIADALSAASAAESTFVAEQQLDGVFGVQLKELREARLRDLDADGVIKAVDQRDRRALARATGILAPGAKVGASHGRGSRHA